MKHQSSAEVLKMVVYFRTLEGRVVKPNYYSTKVLRAILRQKRLVAGNDGWLQIVTSFGDGQQCSSVLFPSIEEAANHIGWQLPGSAEAREYAARVVSRLFRVRPPEVR